MNRSLRHGWGALAALAFWMAVVVGVAGDIGSSVFGVVVPTLETAVAERSAPRP